MLAFPAVRGELNVKTVTDTSSIDIFVTDNMHFELQELHRKLFNRKCCLPTLCALEMFL